MGARTMVPRVAVDLNRPSNCSLLEEMRALRADGAGVGMIESDGGTQTASTNGQP